MLLTALLASTPLPSAARVFATVDEALDRAFPGCTIERSTVFLTDEQRERVARLAGSVLQSAIAYPYEASCQDDSSSGTAYFDAHRVRTLPETLMVVLGSDGAVRSVVVLSFDEPEEYIPRAVWYEQFEGETLDDELRLSRDIDGVTGATLTARSTTSAVRRILALHRVLAEETP